MSRADRYESRDRDIPKISPRRLIGLIVVAALAIIVLLLGGKIVENNDANHLMVVQAPLSGKLTWYTDAGLKLQGFGKVTKYPKRSQFDFLLPADWPKNREDHGGAIQIRFNEGGHGWLSGSIAWSMPLDKKNLDSLHTQYGSSEAITEQLIRRVIEKSIYMTGPVMSSQESYASRRSELLNYIEDQVTNGVYKTVTSSVKQPDPMTGIIKTVQVVNIVEEPGKLGVFARADRSPLAEFGLRTFNLSIKNVGYDDVVEKQIAVQQENSMALQTAIVEARKSEQSAITAAKNGEANAAKAKWEQEVIKARAVTEAQQQLEVARLNAQAAAEVKRKLTLEGEGEGAKRRAIMLADGGLEKKLAAYIRTQEIWAPAIQGYTGAWVPQINMGSTGRGGNAAFDMMSLLSIKAAKDLGLEMGAVGADKTRGEAGR